jgi:hypothetical protein
VLVLVLKVSVYSKEREREREKERTYSVSCGQGWLSAKQVTCATLKNKAPRVLAVSVLSDCRQRLNLASQSQCDLQRAQTPGWWRLNS